MNARDNLQKISDMLNATENDVVDKAEDLLERKRQAEKELEKLSTRLVGEGLEDVMDKVENINGVDVLIHEVKDGTMSQLKELGDRIREKSKNTIALLGSRAGDKISYVCVITDDLLANGKYNAGNMVRQIAMLAGGGGGGRAHMATAGGKDLSKFEAAMQKIKELV
jgi:alanyl-tRNA synthetase